MKVAWISTFPPALCGIGTYSFYLTQELSKHISISIVKNWRSGSIFFTFQIFRETVKVNPSIVHIQHEYMLYGAAQRSALFPLLLFFLKFYRKPVVITMHTVIPMQMLNKKFFADYHAGTRFPLLKRYVVVFFTKLIGWFSNRVIVHTENCRNFLISEYGFDKQKVEVIPHPCMGKTEHVPVQKQGIFTIAQFGFVKDSKGIHHVLNILPQIQEKFNIQFFIIGATRNNPKEIKYTKIVKQIIKEKRLESYVTFINHFVPFEELTQFLSKADIFVFPYTERLLSDSGALKMVISYGKPIIATRVRGFQDLGDSIILINPDNIECELLETLIKFVTNRNLTEEYGVKALKLAEAHNIKKIAQKTLKVYSELLR